jgi:hypothetical protein
VKYLPLFHHFKAIYQFPKHIIFLVKIVANAPNFYHLVGPCIHFFFFFQLQDSNFDFFPLNQALSLQNEEDSQEVKLQELVKNVEYMVNKMKEEVRSFGFYKF